ncbi:hypothetical protein GCM10009630_41150 [Kribbella jejuensis]|uniref:hypothetical protein n=1 Tax=Kribbella jejuensis TaxID=236068 RepID=UPI001152C268|nr:hypothetical protein [Kribbella jejuensis]
MLEDPRGDLTDAPAVLDRMVPDEDVVAWVPELAYGQNGAIAVAYAVDVWLGDDSQRAAWAARQVFEARRSTPGGRRRTV